VAGVVGVVDVGAAADAVADVAERPHVAAYAVEALVRGAPFLPAKVHLS
jgi:hypothetical protein